jgi:hypothetical protein
MSAERQEWERKDSPPRREQSLCRFFHERDQRCRNILMLKGLVLVAQCPLKARLFRQIAQSVGIPALRSCRSRKSLRPLSDPRPAHCAASPRESFGAWRPPIMPDVGNVPNRVRLTF